MKTKLIELKIETKNKFFNRIDGYLEKIDNKRDLGLMCETLSVESIAVLLKILTPRRIELMVAVRNNKPNSIYELANFVDRKQENVQKDVSFLVSLGLINLKETKDNRIKMEPKIDYDYLDVRIPLMSTLTCKR